MRAEGHVLAALPSTASRFGVGQTLREKVHGDPSRSSSLARQKSLEDCVGEPVPAGPGKGVGEARLGVIGSEGACAVSVCPSPLR